MVAAVAVSAPAGEKVRPKQVVFWNLFTRGRSHKTITELVRRFNRDHRDYHVKQVDIPYSQVHTKMLASIAGHVPPDVATFDRFLVASYAAREAFLKLDKRIRDDEKIRAEDFFDAPWAECFYDGNQYAVPYDTDVRVLYYNKKLFREVGLDPNVPPRTWEDLERYSEKLKKQRADGHLERVGYLPIYGNVGSLYLYGWQKGATFTSPDGRRLMLDDPKLVAALEWVCEFVWRYDLEKVMTLQEGFGPAGQNPFMTGKVAMVVWDVGAVSDIERYGPHLEWGAAPCPYPENGTKATWSGGFSLVLPRGARNVEGAWAFCKFILTDDSQRYMATSSNKLPARRSASEDPFFQTSDFWKLAVDEMEHSRYRPISPAGQAIAHEMAAAVEQAVHRKLTPKQALEVANREAQKELDLFYAKQSGPAMHWPALAAALGGAVLLLLAARGWFSYRRIRAMRLHRRQAAAGYLFAMPAILGLVLFTLGPILMSLVYSLTRYEIITPATWSGVENYRHLFVEDRFFLKALWNTFWYTAFSVPINIVLSLGLALLLNRPIGGRALYRTCFYLPTVMPAVAGSLLWMWLFNGEYGLVNVVMGYLHLPSVPWLTNEYCSKPALVVMGMWGVGGGMIIFLAALQGVPRTLYEAAEIDGAGAWRKFWYVTLPMISPAMFFMVVMGIIRSLQVFTQAYLMTRGGPVNSTLFYVLYLYREAFENLHMGYASAMAWVLFVVILLITGAQFVFARRWVYYEGQQR